jgi:hypothetical protein
VEVDVAHSISFFFEKWKILLLNTGRRNPAVNGGNFEFISKVGSLTGSALWPTKWANISVTNFYDWQLGFCLFKFNG